MSEAVFAATDTFADDFVVLVAFAVSDTFADASGKRSSPAVLPSARNRMRPALAAIFGSWVTIITAVPCALISEKMSIISSAAEEFSAPVGSSAKIISGSPINARQIPAR